MNMKNRFNTERSSGKQRFERKNSHKKAETPQKVVRQKKKQLWLGTGAPSRGTA
jgi:hypothetical protein